MRALFGITLLTALLLGAVSMVALVLRFRRAGAVQRQQIKWFAYCAAPSVPLGMFAQVRPWGPYLEFLGAALQLAGLGIGIFSAELLAVVDHTMRPTATSLWLRPSATDRAPGSLSARS